MCETEKLKKPENIFTSVFKNEIKRELSELQLLFTKCGGANSQWSELWVSRVQTLSLFQGCVRSVFLCQLVPV